MPKSSEQDKCFYESFDSDTQYCLASLESYLSMVSIVNTSKICDGPVFEFAREYTHSLLEFSNILNARALEMHSRICRLTAIHVKPTMHFQMDLENILEYYRTVTSQRGHIIPGDELEVAVINFVHDFNHVINRGDISVVGKIAWSYWSCATQGLFGTDSHTMAFVLMNTMSHLCRIPFPLAAQTSQPADPDAPVLATTPLQTALQQASETAHSPSPLAAILESHLNTLWRESDSFHNRRCASLSCREPVAPAGGEMSPGNHPPTQPSSLAVASSNMFL
jgi:hypothetical protein